MSLETFIRNGVWYVKGTVVYKDPETGERCSERIRCSTELGARLPRAEAESWAVRHEAAVLKRLRGEHVRRDEPAINSVTFAKAARAWLAEQPRGASDERRVGRLLDYFGPSALLIDINSPHCCDEAAEAICTRARSPDSRYRAVHRVVSAIVNSAGERWQESGKPKLVSVVSRYAETERTDWLTPHKAADLLAASPERLRTLLRFYLGTGARLMEAITLPWADVDLIAGTAILRDTKNGNSRIVALPPMVIVDLANLTHRDGMVFRRPDGTPYEARDEGDSPIRWELQEPCARIGLVAWRSRGVVRETGRRGPFCPIRLMATVHAHMLRHTWATWLMAATQNPMRVREEGDWSTITLVERYAHLMQTELVADIPLVWGVAHPDMFPARVRERRRAEAGGNLAISAVDLARSIA